MISRYSVKEIDEIWSSKFKYETWLKIELMVCEAMEIYGIIPSGTLEKINDKKILIDINEIEEIEKTTKHDVIAFLTYVENSIGDDSRYVHWGLTSSDITDTGFSMVLVETVKIILNNINELITVLSNKIEKYKLTPMIGRSHGMHAEPITFGLMLSGHLSEIKRNKIRLTSLIDEISVGKISGAVGTYRHLSPSLEQFVLNKLGLISETVSTQIVARDRYASLFCVFGLVAASLERLAQNIRHLQRTEIGELEESFTTGQKGSSAMPHKRNPISCENICGLSRIIRSYITPALENISLWHERDISHSSVERVITPDAASLLTYMIKKSVLLIKNLKVNEDKMLENLNKTNGLIFSECVLLKLIERGMNRQKAYAMVQRNAMLALNGEEKFICLLKHDPEINKLISDDEIEQLFDIDESIKHVSQIIDRA